MATNKTIDCKPALSIGVFFSPPEQSKISSFDNYHAPSRFFDTVGMSRPVSRILPPISPPISPLKVAGKKLDPKDEVDDGVKDPQLFPDEKVNPGENSPPLFPKPRTSHRVVNEHTKRRKETLPRSLDPFAEGYIVDPSQVSFCPRVIDRYKANPQKYIRQELEYLKAYKFKPFAQWAGEAAGQKRKAVEQQGDAKRQRGSKAATVITKLPRAKRMAKPAPTQPVIDSFDVARVPYLPESKAAARSTPHRDDTDYDTIVDYSPPLETLGSSSKSLKTEWRGHPLDLSTDPDRDMLHEAEIGLASTLRLTCAQYLCSKRRIFAGRLDCLRVGKDFRKTTAQQACKIDVNKASKLWSAFDKVGWFDPKYMSKFL